MYGECFGSLRSNCIELQRNNTFNRITLKKYIYINPTELQKLLLLREYERFSNVFLSRKIPETTKIKSFLSDAPATTSRNPPPKNRKEPTIGAVLCLRIKSFANTNEKSE